MRLVGAVRWRVLSVYWSIFMPYAQGQSQTLKQRALHSLWGQSQLSHRTVSPKSISRGVGSCENYLWKHLDPIVPKIDPTNHAKLKLIPLTMPCSKALACLLWRTSLACLWWNPFNGTGKDPFSVVHNNYTTFEQVECFDHSKDEERILHFAYSISMPSRMFMYYVQGSN